MHLNILIVTWPTEKDRQSQAVHRIQKTGHWCMGVGEANAICDMSISSQVH